MTMEDRRSRKFDGFDGTFATSRDEDRIEFVDYAGAPDPFMDICIHGVGEAKIIDGFRKSYNCTQCFPPEQDEGKS
jgi:hypothetical protein